MRRRTIDGKGPYMLGVWRIDSICQLFGLVTDGNVADRIGRVSPNPDRWHVWTNYAACLQWRLRNEALRMFDVVQLSRMYSHLIGDVE